MSFRSEGLAGWRGGLRRPLAGLEGKQLPAPALDSGECRQGGGRVDGVGCQCHDTTLLWFRLWRKS
jgi:hypothetical protein